MPTVIMTKGLPGSGKSTWAIDQVAHSKGGVKRVSTDDLRAMLDAGHHSRGNEKFMLAARDQLVTMILAKGQTAIVDATHLNPIHETRLRQLAREGGATFTVHDLTDVPIECCIERDLKRPRSVGERVIREMWARYLAPQPPAYDPMLPDCVIVDLDGTLADLGDRDPYNASTCEDDAVNEHVRAAVEGLALCRHVVIFSGRSGLYREPTEWWLATHGVNYEALYMRTPEDMRRDSIVKQEMYEAHVKGRYNVTAVVDDRPQVIWECWRALGLPVIDVGKGVWF